MKITCTKKEKYNLIDSIDTAQNCVFDYEYCLGMDQNCFECMENHITWKMKTPKGA